MTKKTKRRQHMWKCYPYGKWTCADGREVLFNRGYKPIFSRYDGQVVEADADEHINFEKQEWFYNDTTTPWDMKKSRQLCESVLHDWGITTSDFN